METVTCWCQTNKQNGFHGGGQLAGIFLLSRLVWKGISNYCVWPSFILHPQLMRHERLYLLYYDASRYVLFCNYLTSEFDMLMSSVFVGELAERITILPRHQRCLIYRYQVDLALFNWRLPILGLEKFNKIPGTGGILLKNSKPKSDRFSGGLFKMCPKRYSALVNNPFLEFLDAPVVSGDRKQKHTSFSWKFLQTYERYMVVRGGIRKTIIMSF